MKTIEYIKPALILCYGLLIGYIVEFFVSLLQHFVRSDFSRIPWFYVLCGLGFFIVKYSIDRIQDKALLAKFERILLAVSIFTLLVGLALVSLTISNYVRFSTETKTYGIGLVLSNLIAIIYWSVIRNTRSV